MNVSSALDSAEDFLSRVLDRPVRFLRRPDKNEIIFKIYTSEEQRMAQIELACDRAWEKNWE